MALFASRRGLGKTRHIDTQFLWVQERIQAGDFTLHKENTNDNVGDLFTKHLDQSKSADFTSRLGYAAREGSASLTLRAALAHPILAPNNSNGQWD